MLDLRDLGDPGWQQPIGTALALQTARVFTVADINRLGFFGLGLIEAFRRHTDEQERRVTNAIIAQILEEKGFDSVAYSNRNEPNDGVARDAYCVFQAQFILPINAERFERPQMDRPAR